MGGIFAGFALVGSIILVGYVAGRAGIAGPSAGPVLSRIAFFITNPALLFTILAGSELGDIFSALVPLALAAAVLTCLLYWGLSALWFQRKGAEVVVGAMASSYVNANHIGIPVAVYAIGNATPVAPVLLVQLLVLSPLFLLLLDLTTGQKPTLRSLLAQPVRNPMIIASFLGAVVAWTGLELPPLLWDPLKVLGGAAVPLVLMAFGMSLPGSRPLRPGGARTDVLVASGLKAAIMPALTFVLARYVFAVDDTQAFAAVIMSALPTAQNVFLFSSRYDRGAAIARDSILLTSVAAIPAVVAAALLMGR